MDLHSPRVIDGLFAHLEWHIPGDHEVKQHSQSPHVDRASDVVVVLEKLGRSVRGRSAEGPQLLVLVSHADAEAQVAQLDSLWRHVEHVLRFDVAVDHVVLMLLIRVQKSRRFITVYLISQMDSSAEERDGCESHLCGLSLIDSIIFSILYSRLFFMGTFFIIYLNSVKKIIVI